MSAVLVLLGLGLIGGAWCWGLFLLTRATIEEFFEDGFDKTMLGLTTVIAWGMSLAIWGGMWISLHEESRNPCVAWGPPETTYMMVGKVLTPLTTTPCIKRQNEIEK